MRTISLNGYSIDITVHHDDRHKINSMADVLMEQVLQMAKNETEHETV